MALVNCGECGKEVSATAKVCPHCGNKGIQKERFKEWKKENPTKWKVILGVGFLFLFSTFFLMESEPSDCECSKLMSKYGIRKSHNQFVPKEDKDDHMYCVKHHFLIPTNEDGSDPCK